jgi:hypothetical protein
MSTKITPYEVAELALRMNPELGKPQCDNHAIHRALAVLIRAEQALEQREESLKQLKELRVGVLTIDPVEWDERVKAFSGDPADLQRLLSEAVKTERVQNALFKDKSLSRTTRRTYFLGLVTFARAHGLRPPPTRNWTEFPSPKVHPESAGEEWSKRMNEAEVERVNEAIRTMQSDLDQAELPVSVVRWAVEVRKRHLAEQKSRTIPQSKKQRREKSEFEGDSIQFKAKHRG